MAKESEALYLGDPKRYRDSVSEPVDDRTLLNATERAINPEYYTSQVIVAVPGYSETNRDAWRAQNDGAFITAARDANEGLGILEGQRGYIDAKTLKAWAMVESGGMKSAFLTDPLQTITVAIGTIKRKASDSARTKSRILILLQKLQYSDGE